MVNKTFETEKGRAIIKKPVQAWVVTVRGNSEDSQTVFHKPMITEVTIGPDRDMFDSGVDCFEGEEILDVIPAQEGTFEVSAPFGEHGDWFPLGFEYPNASNPNWDNLIERHDKEYNGEYDE